MSTVRLIATVCTAQVLAQIGAYTLAALLPTLIQTWALSNAEAGWITGIFYAAYTLAVPVLVSLTDRVAPKRVYCCGVVLLACSHLGFMLLVNDFWSALACRMLAGVGWAGTYMPGLKVLGDVLSGRTQTRAVAWHAASVGISGALSFVVAGTVAIWFGWRWAFGFGALCAAGAFLLGTFVMPAAPRRQPAAQGSRALLDFRPVLRNRSAMAYALSYCVHTWEMNTLRGWVVTFLTFTMSHHATTAVWLGPTVIATMMGLIGTWASVFGNELSIRFGRSRLVLTAMLGAMVLASVLGFASAISYTLAASLVLAYGLFIWLDSSSLTAGALGSATPEDRGATLAVHSTLGYAGGFVGPLMLGWLLDLMGGRSVLGWGMAFAHVAVVMVVGLLAMLVLRPQALAGDRPVETVDR